MAAPVDPRGRGLILTLSNLEALDRLFPSRNKDQPVIDEALAKLRQQQNQIRAMTDDALSTRRQKIENCVAQALTEEKQQQQKSENPSDQSARIEPESVQQLEALLTDEPTSRLSELVLTLDLQALNAALDKHIQHLYDSGNSTLLDGSGGGY
ncbi:MAG: hypothetical protein HY069_04045 [Chlamydiia bacterium]|nr:hypothetical protein [Chlamydiia bacterium]